jgi:hypothetical protein
VLRGTALRSGPARREAAACPGVRRDPFRGAELRARARVRRGAVPAFHAAVLALAVPKRTVEAEILLCDGSGGRFALFLAEHASRHEGPEELADLLEADGAFLPARDLATGRIAFLRREAIALAAVSGGLDPFALAPAEQHALEARLAGGHTVRGVVAYVLPPDRARVLDHLNQPGAFFALHGDDGVVRLVAKRHVTRVDALER